MYQVNIGTNILYYPGSDDAVIYDTELTEDVGLAGEFRFKVPPKNPQYSQLSNGSLVTILKDGKEFWRGEIRDVQTDFAKIASVYVSISASSSILVLCFSATDLQVSINLSRH